MTATIHPSLLVELEGETKKQLTMEDEVRSLVIG